MRAEIKSLKAEVNKATNMISTLQVHVAKANRISAKASESGKQGGPRAQQVRTFRRFSIKRCEAKTSA
jgi:hypothetical protein